MPRRHPEDAHGWGIFKHSAINPPSTAPKNAAPKFHWCTPLLLDGIAIEALQQAGDAVQASFSRAFMRVMVDSLSRADKRALEMFGSH